MFFHCRLINIFLLIEHRLALAVCSTDRSSKKNFQFFIDLHASIPRLQFQPDCLTDIIRNKILASAASVPVRDLHKQRCPPAQF